MAIYRTNRPRGQFIEKKKVTKLFNIRRSNLKQFPAPTSSSASYSPQVSYERFLTSHKEDMAGSLKKIASQLDTEVSKSKRENSFERLMTDDVYRARVKR